MLLFFAGAEGDDFGEILKKNGVKNALESFWSLKMKNPCHHKDFENHLLDSGGFAARQRGVEVDVVKYAEYIRKFDIKFAFNLDVRDLETSLANQRYLEENTNAYIIPIYHGPEWVNEDTRDLLDYYMEFYPYIGLGGIAGKETGKDNLDRFLNYVFKRTRNKTMVHGLGATSKRILYKYPFATADSTSWLAVSQYGRSAIYSENMSKVRNKRHNWKKRIYDDVVYFKNLNDEVTRMWEKRGVHWDNKLDYEKLISLRKKAPSYKEWKANRNAQ